MLHRKNTVLSASYNRMDCGSFGKEVIFVLGATGKYLFIGAQCCTCLNDTIRQVEKWEDVEIGFQRYQIASFQYARFGQDKTYRYVVSREKNKDAQGDLYTGDDFKYQAIMANELNMRHLEVIHFLQCPR